MPNDEAFHEHLFSTHIPQVLIQWGPQKLGPSGEDIDEAMAREGPIVFLRGGSNTITSPTKNGGRWVPYT